MIEEELITKVKEVFTKIGVAIGNGTAITLTEEEVKTLAKTTVGDFLLTVAQDSEYAILH